MDVSGWASIIANLGFPIAVCVALFIQMNKQSESHKNEMAEIRTAVENNTLALTKLLERIGDK